MDEVVASVGQPTPVPDRPTLYAVVAPSREGATTWGLIWCASEDDAIKTAGCFFGAAPVTIPGTTASATPASSPASGEGGPYTTADGHKVINDAEEKYHSVVAPLSDFKLTTIQRGELASAIAVALNTAAGRASVQGEGVRDHFPPYEPPVTTKEWKDAVPPTPDLRAALEECVKAMQYADEMLEDTDFRRDWPARAKLASALTLARRTLGGGA